MIAFLLLGLAAPKRYQVKARRRLPGDPARVWPYLVEASRFPLWFPFVMACEPVGEPRVQVGARRRVRLDRNRREGEREEVLGTLEPLHLVAFEHSRERWGGRRAAWRAGRLELRLESEEGGSTLFGSFWFEGAGALGRISCLLFLRKRHEADLRAALANLEKRLVEESFEP